MLCMGTGTHLWLYYCTSCQSFIQDTGPIELSKESLVQFAQVVDLDAVVSFEYIDIVHVWTLHVVVYFYTSCVKRPILVSSHCF